MSGRNPKTEVRRSLEVFDARTANSERADKLRRNALRLRARKHGLELRHSSRGYSLIDGTRQQLDGRNDLTLDEVATKLDGLSA